VIYRIVITTSARVDLSNIGEFIRESAGELTAERFIQRLIAKIQTLEFAPERRPLREDLRLGLRTLHLADYLIFYHIVEDAVLILRVIHGARDISRAMF
jgi:toxin ParE1/3/4